MTVAPTSGQLSDADATEAEVPETEATTPRTLRKFHLNPALPISIFKENQT